MIYLTEYPYFLEIFFQEVQNEKQKLWFELNVFLQEVSSDEAGSILGSPMDRSETATTRGGTSQKTLDQLKKRRKSHSLLSVPPGGVMTRNNTESSTSISVKEWGRLVIFVLLVVLCDILSFTDLVWYLKSFFVYCLIFYYSYW